MKQTTMAKIWLTYLNRAIELDLITANLTIKCHDTKWVRKVICRRTNRDTLGQHAGKDLNFVRQSASNSIRRLDFTHKRGDEAQKHQDSGNQHHGCGLILTKQSRSFVVRGSTRKEAFDP